MTDQSTTPKTTENVTDSEPAATPQQTREISKQVRQWGMFCHLAGLAWMFPLSPIIGGIVGTLIIWQIKRDDDPFIDECGRQALNFQISMLLYAVGLCITVVGIYLTPIVGALNIIFTIIAAVRAGDGKEYKYPLSIEFIKG